MDIDFTFHDVSINTYFHSSSLVFCVFFTFHDVSINTFVLSEYVIPGCSFTFHDVSINTAETKTVLSVTDRTLHSTMFLLIRRGKMVRVKAVCLYIPRCFY